MNRTSSTRLLTAIAAALALVHGAHAAPVTYEIDPMHTFPSFEADHMGGLSVWRGKMVRNSGKVLFDKAAGSGSVDLTIDPAGIDFGLPALNTWAVGADFLDVKKYPTATYKGKLDNVVAGVPTQLSGELTLHGITRPVMLKINSLKCIPHPMLKREVCGADAVGTFNRDEFGLGMGKEYGFKMDVVLRVQIEAVAAE